MISARAPRQKAGRSDIFFFFFPSRRPTEKETNLRSFILRDLLPSSVDGYYRYTGSLTTPPCSKVVEWIVFSRPVYVSHSQVRPRLLSLTHTHTHTLRQLYSPRTVGSHLHAASGSLAAPQCGRAGNFFPLPPPHLPCPHIKRHIYADAL